MEINVDSVKNRIIEVLSQIKAVDVQVRDEAKKRMDLLVKPLGSLGELELIAIRIAAIQRSLEPNVKKRITIVIAADHGIVEEGIACAPSSVTAMQTINMLKGITGVCVLSRSNAADMEVVDIGVNCELQEFPGMRNPFVSRKVAYGSRNFSKERALESSEVEQALWVGIERVKNAVEQGYQVIGTGEMGIGNTSVSSAILMALSGKNAELLVGKGGGISEEAFLKKKKVIEKALEFHGILYDVQVDTDRNASFTYDEIIDILSKVGGLDLIGMSGLFLGAAYYQVSVVMDGFISAVAAYVADLLCPNVKEYIFPSHISMEPGYLHVIQAMGLEPIFHLKMRLGEGSGCPLAFSLMQSACDVMNCMATFDEAMIDSSHLVDIR